MVSEKVSIIIPTYNSSKTLKECLMSIKSNKIAHEIIIVDSHSSDSTLKISRDFEAQIFINNSLPGKNRNFGALKSINKYLLFIDSDEKLKKDTLKECIKLIREYDFVCFNFIFIGREFWSGCSALLKNTLSSELKKKYSTHPIPRFFKKDFFLSKALYSNTLLLGEDWELYSRIKKFEISEAKKNPIVYHIEPSLKESITKEYRYGMYTRRFKKTGIPNWPKKILLPVIKSILKNQNVSPTIKIGTLTVLFLRSSSRLIGNIRDILYPI
jgi:glycosyltransferase involved in cell wall biosynthesis